jgi:hypothetical protein
MITASSVSTLLTGFRSILKKTFHEPRCWLDWALRGTAARLKPKKEPARVTGERGPGKPFSRTYTCPASLRTSGRLGRGSGYTRQLPIGLSSFLLRHGPFKIQTSPILPPLVRHLTQIRVMRRDHG